MRFISIFLIKINFVISKEGFTIQEEKVYYNQKSIISEIHNRTNCSIYEISLILNSLENIVKDKFASNKDYVEIKLFPGLKLISKQVPQQQFKSNLGILNTSPVLILCAEFSRSFKDKIKEKINMLNN